MKYFLTIVICLLCLNYSYGQEPIIFPRNYKTIQDSSFAPGDTIVLKFQFNPICFQLEPQEWVDSLSKFILNHPEFKYTIVSHTDTRGSNESNLRLSWERSQKLVYDLYALGVDSAILTAVGKGESQPVYSDEVIAIYKTKELREKAHAINRRTEIYLERK